MADKEEWFRRTSWEPEAKEAFYARLKRSRSTFHKAQYLRIQALHLQETRQHPLVEAALDLLAELLTNHPDPSQLAQAHHHCHGRRRGLGFAVEDVARTLGDAFAHADAPAAAIAAAAGPDAHARLRRFFLSWLDPSAIAPLPSTLRPAWRDSRFHFEAGATRTEVMLAAMPHDEGLTLHLPGGGLVHVIAVRLPNCGGLRLGLAQHGD